MMSEPYDEVPRSRLTLYVILSDALTEALRAEIVALCDLAYQEDLAALFATFGSAR